MCHEHLRPQITRDEMEEAYDTEMQLVPMVHAMRKRGIRINAVGPHVIEDVDRSTGALLTNEPDVATLALYLASRKGRSLSGHVFDGDGIGC